MSSFRKITIENQNRLLNHFNKTITTIIDNLSFQDFCFIINNYELPVNYGKEFLKILNKEKKGFQFIELYHYLEELDAIEEELEDGPFMKYMKVFEVFYDVNNSFDFLKILFRDYTLHKFLACGPQYINLLSSMKIKTIRNDISDKYLNENLQRDDLLSNELIKLLIVLQTIDYEFIDFYCYGKYNLKYKSFLKKCCRPILLRIENYIFHENTWNCHYTIETFLRVMVTLYSCHHWTSKLKIFTNLDRYDGAHENEKIKLIPYGMINHFLREYYVNEYFTKEELIDLFEFKDEKYMLKRIFDIPLVENYIDSINMAWITKKRKALLHVSPMDCE